MKKLSVVLFYLFTLPLCFAQGALYNTGGPVTTSLGAGINGATITVCTSAGTVATAGAKCTPTASIFSDAALSVPINQTTNPIVTSGGGSFSFYAVPGNYCYSVTGQNISSTFCYAVQLPVTVGSAGSLASLVITGSLNVSGVSTLSGTSVSLRERDCRQDGTIDLTGAVDASAVINACVAAAKVNQQSTIALPCGNILLTASTINATNFPGVHIAGCGFQAAATNPPTQTQGVTNLWCNQGTSGICIDFTGSGSHELDHVNVILFKAGLTGAGMGILQGRDNSGGGGSANPLCFNENFKIHDIYITDNGASSLTLNSNRGFVGIYNVSAENGLYENIQVLADTPMVFSQNNVLGTVSPYQTLQTGCPLSMTGVTMNNPVLVNSSTTLPDIEANTTNAFALSGYQCVGGSACFKFENTAGASATAGWVITGLTEQSSADIISTSVNLANMKFFMLVANPPPGVVFKPLAINLTFDQMTFAIDDFFALAPFIDNAQTGTTIRGSVIHIGAATSASNTTITGGEVFAPTLADGSITFNTASNYIRHTTSGISTVGLFRATEFLATSNGSLTAPALGITSSQTGWFMDSNTIWQLTYGGTPSLGFTALMLGMPVGMDVCWSSNVDPNNASCDTGFSRGAPDFIVAGNGTTGNASAVFASDGNTVALTADWTCGTAGTVASCVAAQIVGSGGGVPLTFTLPLVARSWTWECDGVVGQATAATANSWNFLTATNGATNVTANYTMNTAATAMAGGAITDQVSTTSTVVIGPTWTLGGTATKMPFHVWGRVEGASASGTVLSLQLVAPTVGDLVTIYRGTSCRIR